MSISSGESGEQVREAARKAGTGLSAWLAGAAAARLRSEALDEFLHTWEKKHGPLTPEELSWAEREIGDRASKKSARWRHSSSTPVD